MTDKTGGPAFRCGRGTCSEPAIRKQGHQWLCVKHYRYGQMRATATRRGLYSPTDRLLDQLITPDFLCPDCGIKMNWLSSEGNSTVASLQHYRDGSLGIVCRSCNTRHAFMPGDSYREMPKDHKLCPQCNSIKPLSDFSVDNNREGNMRCKSHCKTCSDKSTNEWRKNNREKYNAYQRKFRAKKKSEAILKERMK